MLETKNKESNYLCKVVELRNVRMHNNAHSLQCVNVGMNTVITGMDAKDGDIYVFFPLESKISQEFLSYTNSFRDSMMNADTTKKGYFEPNCRVRATRLRGEKSMGYVVPARQVEQWSQMNGYIGDYVGQEFDTINGKLLVEKYEAKPKRAKNAPQGKQPKLNRLVDGQINLHAKTKNLRHYPEAIEPDDTISITYKTHGTSWWIANVLTKRKLSFWERLGQKLGLSVQATDYDVMYGSRNVVKNRFYGDPKQQDHFYGVNVWKEIRDQIGHLVPKGWTLYGEALGFTETGEYIQKPNFDYGCDPKGENGKPRMKLEVYRITVTNADGEVIDLSFPQIEEFCINVGLNTPHLYFYGKAKEIQSEFIKTVHKVDTGETLSWGESFVEILESKYNEKDCFMCNNSVPEEGVVIRKERAFGFEGYKLKSFRFLEKETKQLDKGESNIEDEN